MIDKKKTATAGTVAASHTAHSRPKRSISVIAAPARIRIALCGMITPTLAAWLIRLGGLSHD